MSRSTKIINMDQKSNKVSISLSANKPKSITLSSPNIYGSFMLSKHSRSSQIYVTPKKEKTGSKEASFVNKDTDIEVSYDLRF